MSRFRTETIGDATLYLGDCREVLPTLPCAALVFSSPPYTTKREYGGNISPWDDLVPPAFVSANAGQILVNLGPQHEDGEVVEYWRPLIEAMRAAGWRFFAQYVWDQGPGMPGDWAGRLAPAHEFIFHFNKTARKPNKTEPSLLAGYIRSQANTGMRLANGEMSGWSHGTAPTQASKIPDSVLRIMRHKARGGPESDHPAVFPVRLPAFITSAYTDTGELVCEPFMGSGTTGIAAIKLGRRFIGIEIEPKYFDIACRRIEEAWRQPRVFDEPKPQPAQEELAL